MPVRERRRLIGAILWPITETPTVLLWANSVQRTELPLGAHGVLRPLTERGARGSGNLSGCARQG
jgi:hypothetical protein